MDKLHPAKFMKNWFQKQDLHEQARLARVRKLVGVDKPKGDINFSSTIVKAHAQRKKTEVLNRVRWEPGEGWMDVKLRIDEVRLRSFEIEGKSIFANGPAFVNALAKKGFEPLGRGAFGSVLKHPKSDRVIKVIHRPDGDGWPAYVKWATDAGYAGTLAPKIFSYKYIKSGKFAIASMEQLDETVEKAGKKSDLFAKYKMFAAVSGSDNQMLHDLADLVEPGMAKFVKDFEKKFRRANDLHDGNVMSRKGTMVVTDPLAYGGHPHVDSWKLAA